MLENIYVDLCFSTFSLFILFFSIILFAFSVFLFENRSYHGGIVVLFFGSLSIGIFIATLDPFLGLWDEQYHALVSKNMIHFPLKPMLYRDPLLEYHYGNWTENHIWLHKQPLFLWQIAMSLKVFGFHEFAVRIPSILLHSLNALLVYRIGEIVFSRQVGFYAALLFSVSNYNLELIVGRNATDHNDVVFLFYVSASFWAWFEYTVNFNRKWTILIGLFAGCAVLNKWLAGLLVYPVWLITLLFLTDNFDKKLSEIKVLIRTFFISFLVFIPWQIFILLTYPNEAFFEFKLISDHLFKVIENHDGDLLFHFASMKKLYGSGMEILGALTIGMFLLIKRLNSNYRYAISCAILLTYGFYTIAATKMPSFCIIVSPFFYLGMGIFICELVCFLQSKADFGFLIILAKYSLIFLYCFSSFNYFKIKSNHTECGLKESKYRLSNLAQMELIDKIELELCGDNWVIFNAAKRLNGHIPVMFYTDKVAYNFIPSFEQVEKIDQKKYKIAVIDHDSLPEFLYCRSDILLLK